MSLLAAGSIPSFRARVSGVGTWRQKYQCQKEGAGTAGTATQLLIVWRGHSVSLRDIPMQVGQPVQFVLLVLYAHKAEGFPGFPEGFQPWTMGDVPALPEVVTLARTQPED